MATALRTRYTAETDFNLDINQQIAILDATILGTKTTSICKDLDIDWRSVYAYANKDPIFKKKWRESRDIYLESQIECLFTIADGLETMTEVNAARVKSDNIKWIAGKWKPEIYGENLNISMNHSLDLSSILLAAENRVLPILQAKTTNAIATIDVESSLVEETRTPLLEDLF